jgi:hypothetical protein
MISLNYFLKRIYQNHQVWNQVTLPVFHHKRFILIKILYQSVNFHMKMNIWKIIWLEIIIKKIIIKIIKVLIIYWLKISKDKIKVKNKLIKIKISKNL